MRYGRGGGNWTAGAISLAPTAKISNIKKVWASVLIWLKMSGASWGLYFLRYGAPSQSNQPYYTRV